jgi:SAM-dependent methyltransferase
MPESRATSEPAFWDERYRMGAPDGGPAFSLRPNPFVEAQAHRIRPGGRVADAGAGEGRHALHLARLGHPVLAVDFAGHGLRTLTRLAVDESLPIEALVADASDAAAWAEPDAFAAVVATFVHPLPEERARMYAAIQEALAPGGVLIGEWFRPAHLSGAYARIGPSKPDRLVSAAELREHFDPLGFLLLDESDSTFDLGFLDGEAATVQVVWKKPTD